MTQQATSYDHFEVARHPDGSLWVLGQGAMGVTYKAFDNRLKCSVALKVIQSALFADPVAKERFLREARSAASVHHPNVASVFYLGESAEEIFYTMELVEGVSVEEELRRIGKMDPASALSIALQICRALHTLHRAGLVHRDIKPANIMLLNTGEGEVTAKLVDFGLAKSVVGVVAGATLTQAPGFLGTPYYSSPEQINEQDVDTRSDIYSLGATLFTMLAGRPPFSGTLAIVFDRSLHEAPPLDMVPDEHRKLLARMLAKRPDDRYQTPQELRIGLETALHRISPVPPVSPVLSDGVPEVGASTGNDVPAELGGHPATSISFSLLELLKKRRALPVTEAMVVLDAIAAALDNNRAADVPGFSGSLASIVLKGTDLSFANVGACSAIDVIFQAERTMVPGATSHVGASNSQAAGMPSPQLLAHVAYELLGGSDQGKDRWAPLPALSANGNTALHRGMEDPQAFQTAAEFVASLKPQEPRRRVGRLMRRSRVQAVSGAADHPPVVPPPVGKGRNWWWLVAAGCASAVVAALLVFTKTGPSGVSPTVQSPGPPPAPVEAAANTPPPEDPSAPFLRAAEECRSRDDNAGMLDNFAKALDANPGLDDPRRQMEMISAKLRSNAVNLTHQKFALLRQPIEEAARHNVVSAQVLLGEWLRSTEPQEALKWFAAAAANGQTEAMTQAGLMMANGLGREAPDFRAAVAWFQQGAAAGDSDAMVSLADCYLYGKGIPRNEIKAVEILQAASALNHPRAMNMLGDLLKKGLPGQFAPNYPEAFRLFSSAQKIGNPDAQANLGVMYVNGLGVPRDPAKAYALWKDGAENLRNPLCMFFYAIALEGGLAGEKKPAEARDWYYRAAKAGNRSAAEWCKQNGIPLVESR